MRVDTWELTRVTFSARSRFQAGFWSQVGTCSSCRIHRRTAVALAQVVEATGAVHARQPGGKHQMLATSAKESPAVALKQAQVKAQQPSGEEVEISTVTTTPPQLLAQNTPPVTAPQPGYAAVHGPYAAPGSDSDRR